MKKRKPLLERSDLTNKVTPYELATLAARIGSTRCIGDPEGAITAAQRLLSESKIALIEERIEERKEKEQDAVLDSIRKDWPRAIKDITCEARRDRAMKRFKHYLESKYPGEAKKRLSIYKRDGFTLREILFRQGDFSDWRQQPKRKKGKQGRRISQRDGRLRTDLVALQPRKPWKPRLTNFPSSKLPIKRHKLPNG